MTVKPGGIARFEPINSAHAIVETMFFCEFNSPLGNDSIERLLELEHEENIRAELPAFKKVEAASILFSTDNEGLNLKEKLPKGVIGAILQRVRPDGTPEWHVQVSQDTLLVQCFEYSDWKRTWAKAKKYIQAVLFKILPSEVLISSIGLKYVDQFVFEGDYKVDYNPRLLFNPETALIHKKGFDSGYRWHCHTGWFDPFEGVECLNQLNIDAAILQKGTHTTKIEHNMVMRSLNTNIEKLLELEVMNKYMAYMHQANKKVLLDILTSQMAKRISL